MVIFLCMSTKVCFLPCFSVARNVLAVLFWCFNKPLLSIHHFKLILPNSKIELAIEPKLPRPVAGEYYYYTRILLIRTANTAFGSLLTVPEWTSTKAAILYCAIRSSFVLQPLERAGGSRCSHDLRMQGVSNLVPRISISLCRIRFVLSRGILLCRPGLGRRLDVPALHRHT